MTGTIVITHAVSQTWIVIGALLVALFVSSRATGHGDVLPMRATQELKGVAILAVLFGHIGYFLVDDNRFLFPLSIAAGIGVNIFLFLSGYGLTVGMLRKPLSTSDFYRKRALRIFIPFWIVLLGLLVLDEVALGRVYSPTYIVRSLLGFFPRADMATDINSVFWYITWILFCYLLFPLLFMRRRVWLSALMLFASGQALVALHPHAIEQVRHLYAVHTMAFPLGMWIASLLCDCRGRPNAIALAASSLRAQAPAIQYYAIIAALIALIIYAAAFDSGIGVSANKEQWMSLITTLAAVALFAAKRVEFRALSLVGAYSYEIYLLHWPLLSRYDVFYSALPPAAATVAYLALFILAGWMLQRLTALLADGPAMQPAGLGTPQLQPIEDVIHSSREATHRHRSPE